MTEAEKIISPEIKKFFNKKYIKYFNEIKKQDDFSKNIFDIKKIKWDKEDEKQNGKKEDFFNDKFKSEKIKFIKYYSPKNKVLKDFNIYKMRKNVMQIKYFFHMEKKIKNKFKKMEIFEKKKTLDKMILYISLMSEVLSSYEIPTLFSGGVYSIIFSMKFFKDYEYCNIGNDYNLRIADYNQCIYYFDQKNDSIMKFISEKKDFGNFFSDKFYKLFFNINEIKMNQKIFKTEELCGICLVEYNDDVISYCGKHFICLECFNETDVETCINNCVTREFSLYKKV